MDLKTNVLSGMITGVGGFFIKIIASLLLVPLVIHYLGAESYGFYVFLFAFADILMALDMGITMGLIQRLSHYISLNDAENKQAQLMVGHWLFSGFALLILLSGLSLSPWIVQFFNLKGPQLAMAPTVLTLVFADAAINLYGCYHQSILKAHCLHRWINICDTVQAIGFNLVCISLLMLGFGLVEMFISRLLISLLVNSVYLVRAQKAESLCLGFQKSSWRALSDLFSMSFYTLLQRLSMIFSRQMDGLLIARFLTLGDVGIYGLINRVCSYILMICWKITDTVYPVFTRLASGEQPEQARLLYIRLNAFLCFAVTLMIILLLGALPEIVSILGSGKIPFDLALNLTLVVVPAIWSGSIAAVSVNYLFAIGQPQKITKMNLLMSLINLGMSITLVQWLGFIGPALATTLISVIYHQLFAITLACQHLRLPRREFIHQVYTKNLLPLVAATLCVLLGRYLTQFLPDARLIVLVSSMIAVSLSVILWLSFSATSIEHEFLKARLLPKLSPLTSKWMLPFAKPTIFKPE